MKSGVLLTIMLAFNLQGVLAQSESWESSTERARANAVYYDRLIPLDASPQSAIVTKKLKITGPLTQPLKSKKLSEVPKKFLTLINPFAKAEGKPGSLERVGDLSPVAWSTAVGWYSGGSGFSNPVTHESQMGLISVSRPKRP